MNNVKDDTTPMKVIQMPPRWYLVFHKRPITRVIRLGQFLGTCRTFNHPIVSGCAETTTHAQKHRCLALLRNMFRFP